MPSRFSECHVLEISGRRIAYRTMGAETAPTVVLIHAFASRSNSWGTVARVLVEHGFRVIAPDLRGHGRSDWAPGYSLAEIEEDLLVLLERLAPGPIDVIGHSLGGHLALRLGARLPRKVRRLVVEAVPVPPLDEVDAAAIRAQQPGPRWWRSLKLLGVGRLVRIALLRQFDFRSARFVLRELKTPMPSWWESLGRIESACLVLTGDDDGMVSARAGQLAAALRDSRLVRIGSGHHLHTKHPEAFLDATLSFLRPGLARTS